MKIPLTSVKLHEPMDSVEPLNTNALSTIRGWTLTLDTDIGTIQGILTRGEGAGAVIRRVEFSAGCAAHWVRENWDEPNLVRVLEKWHIGADGEVDHHSIEPQPEPKEDHHGQESRATGRTRNGRTRKRSGGGRRKADGVQPEAAGGDDPQS